MTYEVLAIFALIAASLAGYALWLKAKLAVALVQEAANAEAARKVPSAPLVGDETKRTIVRGYRRFHSGAVVISSTSNGGVIVEPAPRTGP